MYTPTGYHTTQLVCAMIQSGAEHETPDQIIALIRRAESIAGFIVGTHESYFKSPAAARDWLVQKLADRPELVHSPENPVSERADRN